MSIKPDGAACVSNLVQRRKTLRINHIRCHCEVKSYYFIKDKWGVVKIVDFFAAYFLPLRDYGWLGLRLLFRGCINLPRSHTIVVQLRLQLGMKHKFGVFLSRQLQFELCCV